MACEAGMLPSEFWEITPWQSKIFIKAYANKQKTSQQNRAWLAWVTAALTKTRSPLPALREFMGLPAVQTDQKALQASILATFKAHNQSLKKKKDKNNG